LWAVPGGMTLEAPCAPGRRHTFQNAEAAFQALKFWKDAQAFENLTGDGTLKEKMRRKGTESFSYGGFGSNSLGMKAVLQQKFAPGSELANKLLETGDAYLLEHNAKAGRDKIWSDNSNGEGTNWLGLQLMVLRDTLSGESSWTSFINESIDEGTGHPRDSWWQKSVKDANKALKEQLQKPISPIQPERENKTPKVCTLPGCGKATFEGTPGYCSIIHRDIYTQSTTPAPPPAPAASPAPQARSPMSPQAMGDDSLAKNRGASASDSQSGQAQRDCSGYLPGGIRGLVEKGKKARGVSSSEAYRFGDVTRGLVSKFSPPK